jgi:hypothetical protein
MTTVRTAEPNTPNTSSIPTRKTRTRTTVTGEAYRRSE